MSTSSVRWWDWLSVGVLVVALSIISLRLYVTGWADDLQIIQLLTLLAVIVGLILGKSQFAPGWAFLFATVYGLFAIPWQLGVTIHSNSPWLERLNVLGVRIWNTYVQFADNKPVNDSILFLALMAVLFWIICVLAGYHLVRKANPWLATVPGGIALFIIHMYDPAHTDLQHALGIYVFLSLLLLGRTTYLRNRALWNGGNVFIPAGTEFDFTRAILAIITAGIVISSVSSIVVSDDPMFGDLWRRVSRPWMPVRDRLSDIFAPLESSGGVVKNYRLYGDRLSMGVGGQLGETPVFKVWLSSPSNLGKRFYWRARVYDRYQGGVWQGTRMNRKTIQPGEYKDISFPQYPYQEEKLFTFEQIIENSETLFVVGQPVALDRAAEVFYTQMSDNAVDIAGARALEMLYYGEQYAVRSRIWRPTVDDLMVAGEEYPPDISAIDLQLPASLPKQIPELAQRITSGMQTPYEKAAAITRYLRQNIKYEAAIPDPPEQKDSIEWFLFDYKRGFCNYYATSEILMLRSLGIPARLAVGYAEGSYQVAERVYLVKDKDSHAWPEVFFPGWGWIEFEPTVSQPAIEFPLPGQISRTGIDDELSRSGRGRREQLDEQDENITPPTGSQTPDLGSPLAGRVLLIILGIVLLFLWLYYRQSRSVALPLLIERSFNHFGIAPPKWVKRWFWRMNLSAIELSYNVINRSLKLLGEPPGLSDTPVERATKLVILLPELQSEIEVLLAEYQKEEYGLENGNVFRAKKAGTAIWKKALITRIKWVFQPRMQIIPKITDEA